MARSRDITTVKSIAIVSALGDTLELRHVGFMVFGNASGTMDIADWKIDDDVATTVTQLLKDRYQTVVIRDVDKARFRPKGPGFFGAQIDQNDEVKALATRPDAPAVDAYLVIYPLFTENPISLNNQYLTGPGLYRESKWEAVYCLAIAALVDAQTFDEIDSKWLSMKSDDRLTGSDLPYRRVEGVVPEDFATLTAEQKQQAQAVMKEVVRESVEHVLSRLKLAP